MRLQGVHANFLQLQWFIDKIKQDFFQVVVVSILLYRCTTLMLTKQREKARDRNCTRMSWAILNNSWKQYPAKQWLYSHLPPISKTIQIRWTRYAGHFWKTKDELIGDILWQTTLHECASVGWPTKACLQQLCADIRCSLEDLQGAMDDRDKWRMSWRNSY